MISKGMRVIRKAVTDKPIIGIVKNVYEPQYSRKPILKATIEWQDSTLYINGRTTTTSSINVALLVEATDGNIQDVIAKSKKLTPQLKAALTYWREHYSDEYKNLYDAAAPLGDKQFRYQSAFEKLAKLKYLEPSPENKGKGSSHWQYKLAKKGD